MIYKHSFIPQHVHISQYVSDEDIYWECYWCKQRKKAVVPRGKEFKNTTLRDLKANFVAVHSICRDKTVQLEMRFA